MSEEHLLHELGSIQVRHLVIKHNAVDATAVVGGQAVLSARFDQNLIAGLLEDRLIKPQYVPVIVNA